MNALVKLTVTVGLLMGLNACAYPYGYYAPHLQARYYGNNGYRYYGNYGAYDYAKKRHMDKHHQKYELHYDSAYGDSRAYNRDHSWDHGRQRTWLSRNQYGSDYDGDAPYNRNYNNVQHGPNNREHRYLRHGEGWRTRDDD